jgi:hypothetical protein
MSDNHTAHGEREELTRLDRVRASLDGHVPSTLKGRRIPGRDA